MSNSSAKEDDSRAALKMGSDWTSVSARSLLENERRAFLSARFGDSPSPISYCLSPPLEAPDTLVPASSKVDAVDTSRIESTSALSYVPASRCMRVCNDSAVGKSFQDSRTSSVGEAVDDGKATPTLLAQSVDVTPLRGKHTSSPFTIKAGTAGSTRRSLTLSTPTGAPGALLHSATDSADPGPAASSAAGTCPIRIPGTSSLSLSQDSSEQQSQPRTRPYAQRVSTPSSPTTYPSPSYPSPSYPGHSLYRKSISLPRSVLLPLPLPTVLDHELPDESVHGGQPRHSLAAASGSGYACVDWVEQDSCSCSCSPSPTPGTTSYLASSCCTSPGPTGAAYSITTWSLCSASRQQLTASGASESGNGGWQCWNSGGPDDGGERRASMDSADGASDGRSTGAEDGAASQRPRAPAATAARWLSCRSLHILTAAEAEAVAAAAAATSAAAAAGGDDTHDSAAAAALSTLMRQRQCSTGALSPTAATADQCLLPHQHQHPQPQMESYRRRWCPGEDGGRLGREAVEADEALPSLPPRLQTAACAPVAGVCSDVVLVNRAVQLAPTSLLLQVLAWRLLLVCVQVPLVVALMVVALPLRVLAGGGATTAAVAQELSDKRQAADGLRDARTAVVLQERDGAAATVPVPPPALANQGAIVCNE